MEKTDKRGLRIPGNTDKERFRQVTRVDKARGRQERSWNLRVAKHATRGGSGGWKSD